MRPRLASLCLLLLAACYKTPQPDCGFVCGPAGECPADYACSAVDNRCHRSGAPADLDCRADRGDAAVDGPAPDASAIDAGAVDASPVDASPIDASPVDASSIDASPVDATPIDAAMPDAAMPDAAMPDAAPACPALTPTSDGSGRQALVVSAFKPGMFLELYNNTAASIDLAASAYAVQSDADMVMISSLAGAGTLAAHAYVTLPWTATGATNGGGEIALYAGVATAADYDVEANLVDYLCWGTTNQQRKALALTGAMKFTGDCAGPITMGDAVRRLASTPGTTAADYDAAGSGVGLSCTVP